ncbi:MAG: hypothetical protein EKE20_14505 [Candidatus Symbiopectobacterium sp. Dall1.0]|nr:hypothetical protein [Candidatus Symbiopectobacterium sp. Dall1.0]
MALCDLQEKKRPTEVSLIEFFGGHQIYEDSDWQVAVFASHFLIDSRLVTQSMTANDISRTFGVSKPAAEAWPRINGDEL